MGYVTITWVIMSLAAVSSISVGGRFQAKIQERAKSLFDPDIELSDVSTVKIISVYETRPTFLEGLAWDSAEGVLYASSGIYGKSAVSRLTFPTPSLLSAKSTNTKMVLKCAASTKLPHPRFGEGIVVGSDNYLYQLDYTDKKIHKFSKPDLQEISAAALPAKTQGWGLAYHQGTFYSSDGSSNIYVWHENGTVATPLHIHDKHGSPISMINELEWVNGHIYANYYGSNCIMRIDPTDGIVKGWISTEKAPLFKSKHPGVDVMNGIAYNSDNKHLYLSGKMWPFMFEVLETDVVRGSDDTTSTVPLSKLCPKYTMDAAGNDYWNQLNK